MNLAHLNLDACSRIITLSVQLNGFKGDVCWSLGSIPPSIIYMGKIAYALKIVEPNKLTDASYKISMGLNKESLELKSTQGHINFDKITYSGDFVTAVNQLELNVEYLEATDSIRYNFEIGDDIFYYDSRVNVFPPAQLKFESKTYGIDIKNHNTWYTDGIKNMTCKIRQPHLNYYVQANVTYHESVEKYIKSLNETKSSTLPAANSENVPLQFKYMQLVADFTYSNTNAQLTIRNYGIVCISAVIPQNSALHELKIRIAGKEYFLTIISPSREKSALARAMDYIVELFPITESGTPDTLSGVHISNLQYKGWPGQTTTTTTTNNRTTHNSYTPPPPPKVWVYVGKCQDASFYYTNNKKEWEVRVDGKSVFSSKFKQNVVEHFVVSEHNKKAMSIDEVCKSAHIKNDFIFDIAEIEKIEAQRTSLKTLAGDVTSSHDEYFGKVAYAALSALSPAQRKQIIQQLNAFELAEKRKEKTSAPS